MLLTEENTLIENPFAWNKKVHVCNFLKYVNSVFPTILGQLTVR
jgi:hypothetical protein